jgi:hypothetical protein
VVHLAFVAQRIIVGDVAGRFLQLALDLFGFVAELAHVILRIEGLDVVVCPTLRASKLGARCRHTG